VVRPAPWPLNAQDLDGGTDRGAAAAALTEAEVQPLLAEAIANFQAAGLNPAGVAVLQRQQIQIVSLPQPLVGLYSSGVIYLDSTADGRGWFSATSATGQDFLPGVEGGAEPALPGSPAAGGVDLLTVLEHELGHAIGLGDVLVPATSGELMAQVITPGERRLPSRADVHEAMANSAAGTAPAVATNGLAASSAGSLGGRLLSAEVLSALVGVAVERPGRDTPRDSLFAALGLGEDLALGIPRPAVVSPTGSGGNALADLLVFETGHPRLTKDDAQQGGVRRNLPRGVFDTDGLEGNV